MTAIQNPTIWGVKSPGHRADVPSVSTGRLVTLREVGTCRTCSRQVGPGHQAWWDGDSASLWCLECRVRPAPGSPTVAPSAPRIVPEVVVPVVPVLPVAAAPVAAGPIPVPSLELAADATAESTPVRRTRRWEAMVEQQLGKVARFLADESPAPAGSPGARAHELLLARLEQTAGETGVVLADRPVPGSRDTIDAVVIASSGVWVIAAQHDPGRVVHRDRGGPTVQDLRFTVGGADRSAWVDDLGWQLALVAEALGEAELPIHPSLFHPVLCVIGADWGVLGAPFEHRGVLVTWPRKLTEQIVVPGPLAEEHVRFAADVLARALPPRQAPAPQPARARRLVTRPVIRRPAEAAGPAAPSGDAPRLAG